MKQTEEIESEIDKHFIEIKQEGLCKKYKDSENWDFSDDGICKTLRTPDGRLLRSCEIIN